MAAASYMSATDPEPTLRDIFTALTTCTSSIADLTGEVKGMKVEISLVRHDMQKLREHTSALEGRLGTLEEEWEPCKEMLVMYN